MKKTNLIIKNLKNDNQDYEWYSTTEEIIFDLYKDIKCSFKDHISILDIGAGDGKIFTVLEKHRDKDFPKSEHGYRPNFSPYFKKFAIEKSQILIEEMDKDIIIIGTDFENNTLIDKKMDIIFCNPPYSEFQTWFEKIIKESFCKAIYLVIPDRWENNYNKSLIKNREASYKILGNYDFLNSEDRKARAKVNLVKIILSEGRYENNDPFYMWFDSNFKITADQDQKHVYEEEAKTTISESLVKGENKILQLEQFYNNDLKRLLDNYKALEKLDHSIFLELNIDLSLLKEGLKTKISGLKSRYWKIFFEEIKTITERLTKDSRNKLYEKMISHTYIDFTASNAYSIIIWIIKNANEYIDSQLKSLFFYFIAENNIKKYKSNQKTWEKDNWRWGKEDNISHVALEYRIITENYNSFSSEWRSDITSCKLHKNCLSKIQDIFTIANQLGFRINEDPAETKWSPGKKINFTYYDNVKRNFLNFADIKIFKNGNIHFQFCKNFIRKFNLEIAKLLKWIKNPKEASEEFDITLEEATLSFKNNYHISLKEQLLLE